MTTVHYLKTWLKNEKHTVWFEYGALSLVILLPLLLPGYILSIDMVFTPHDAWPNEVTNTYPLQVLLWLFYHILPGDIIEKIILFIILLFSGVGMHKLLRQIKTKAILDDIWRTAAYLGGIFYMINPFTYSRFMAGQWMMLLGYAFLPFFVRALIRLIALPSWRTALLTSLWVLVISFVSIHHLGIMALLGLVIGGVAVARYWQHKKQLGRVLGFAGISAGLVIVLSSFWLIPALFGHSSISQAVADFNQTDQAAFATNSRGSLGAIGDVVRLQGFWMEGRDLYRLPQDLVPAWGVLFLLIWALVIIGAIKAWRQHRTFVVIGLVSIFLGVVFATTPLVSWLSQVMPPLAGYREPHKFVNLVALGYALLMTFGVGYVGQWMSDRFRERGAQIVVTACALLPFVVTPVMMWGFAGQLTPRSYPNEWYEMNKTLVTTVKPSEKVLFVPWHQYSEFSFSGRLIASPAEKFFEVPIIASDDPEFYGVTSTTPNQEKRMIGKALRDHHDQLVERLPIDHIAYILLAKEDEGDDYSYLDTLPKLKTIAENNKLKLYRLE